MARTYESARAGDLVRLKDGFTTLIHQIDRAHNRVTVKNNRYTGRCSETMYHVYDAHELVYI